MERKLKTNHIYKHFKGTYHKVLAIARDSETLEEKIVYNHLDTEQLWIRDKKEFLSLVDKNKYPNIEQKYRFELVSNEELKK